MSTISEAVTIANIVLSCDLSLFDWRNTINKYDVCGCRQKWLRIKSNVNVSNAESHKLFINSTTGNRAIHIIQCGHVWFGVK
jgi:hypothetical protein